MKNKVPGAVYVPGTLFKYFINLLIYFFTFDAIN